MARNFDRNAVKRLNEQIALEQILSEEERQQAINDALEEEERRDREWNEYCEEFWKEYGIQTLEENTFAMIHGSRERGHQVCRQMHEIDHHRDLSEQLTDELLDKLLPKAPCSVCLCEHHPAADCPADEEVVRRFNDSEDSRDLDMYHNDDFH